jgi:hypothetical protein
VLTPATTIRTSARPINIPANKRAHPALRFVLFEDMMFLILLLKLEPFPAPDTPATFQPNEKRTTLSMLDA